MLHEFYSQAGITGEIVNLAKTAEQNCAQQFLEIEERKQYHQLRVNQAFHQHGLQASDFAGSTGYGYDDGGRARLEAVWAELFEAEAALVRHQFSSGTHVLATCLKAILRPGDELLIASGELYDTLKPTLGIGQTTDSTSLKDFGITYKQIDLKEDFSLDIPAVLANINSQTKMVYIQKSRGYSLRPALTNQQIAELVKAVKEQYSELCIMVDNCYGEFVELTEPTMHGVDICAGSLIKNPGGGIAPTGGYVVGKSKYLELVAQQFTAPGVGNHIGATTTFNRLLFQGLYSAPQAVAEALKIATFTAELLMLAGYQVEPKRQDKRADIVQIVQLANAKELIVYCQAIQEMAAVDSMFKPQPAPMAGYDCDIIMASGSFIQGSSIELSADGPLREPFAVFQQGGLSYAVGRLAVCMALQNVAKLKDGQGD